MTRLSGQFYFFSGSIFASVIAANGSMAQILSDATLPINSIVTPQGNVVTIDGGSQAGNNLFHSFEQFSVFDGNRAFFNNSLDIENIFSRVTGGSISNIDGIIEANGTANLFLINPAGIIFGSNASLNIGGSFLSSTANSVIFSDGTEFSAVNPETEPLLTINMPLGLGFGDNPEPIINRSFATDLDGNFVGLSVPIGKTLALIGGDVLIEGGIITAPEGRVELGSVAGNQTVSLSEVESGWQLSYENVQVFQDINLSNLAVIDTSGESGGAIQIQGKQINFSGDALVLSTTFGSGVGETIEIIASESIDMSGDATRIATESFDTGTAGDLVIETSKLTIRDGAFIETLNFRESISGNLTVKASESLELSGTTSDNGFPSGLFGTVEENATGEGKAIFVATEKLMIRDGAAIFATTLGTGRSVDIIIEASESVELLDASGNGVLPSGLFAEVQEGARGDGGTLTIETKELLVQGGARISTSTFGEGKAGNLNVNASDSVKLIGTEPNNNISSGLFAQVETEAKGDGGTLNIKTAELLVKDGAQIGTTTSGQGNAGNLNVNASESITLIGIAPNNLFPSGLFARVEPEATGNGGTINIETPRLTILKGGQISTAAASEGKGGNIVINVSDSILLSGKASGGDAFSSGIFVSAEPGAIKDAGTLNLTTSQLTVEKEARISADNFGTGAGSNVTLNINRLLIQERGQIGAGSLLGQGATDNERGNGGELNINATESIEIIGTGMIDDTSVNSSLFTRAEGMRGNAGNLNIVTPQLTVSEGGNIDVRSINTAEGAGEAGSLTINAQNIILNNGNLTAETGAGEQGNITLKITGDLTLENDSTISARARENANGGNITIDGRFITAFPAQNQGNDIIANAGAGNGGNIDITAQGIFGLEERKAIDDNNNILNNGTNDIDASSNFGVDGTVVINQLDINPAEGLEELPSDVIDITRLVAQNLCKQDEGSEFILTGKGGLAPSPSQVRNRNHSEVNLVEPALFSENREQKEADKAKRLENQGETIIEAQGWIVNEKGNLELVAYKTDINDSQPYPKNNHICY